MKFKEELEKTGRIPTYKVEDEYELLCSLSDSKPSKRIVNSKKGLKYEGYWKNSMRSGYGIEQYKEGSIYKGMFL